MGLGYVQPHLFYPSQSFIHRSQLSYYSPQSAVFYLFYCREPCFFTAESAEKQRSFPLVCILSSLSFGSSRSQPKRYAGFVLGRRRRGLFPLVCFSLLTALWELAEPAKTLRRFCLRQKTQRFISSCMFLGASLCVLCLARTSAMPFVRLCGFAEHSST